jgi:hypothetical protein
VRSMFPMRWTYSTSGSTQQQVATPVFTPPGGNYTAAQSATISDSTLGAQIYYTTKGSAPTTTSLRRDWRVRSHVRQHVGLNDLDGEYEQHDGPRQLSVHHYREYRRDRAHGERDAGDRRGLLDLGVAVEHDHQPGRNGDLHRHDHGRGGILGDREAFGDGLAEGRECEIQSSVGRRFRHVDADRCDKQEHAEGHHHDYGDRHQWQHRPFRDGESGRAVSLVSAPVPFDESVRPMRSDRYTHRGRALG